MSDEMSRERPRFSKHYINLTQQQRSHTKYNPQREFPRDRYTRDFKDGADWPACSVIFEIDEQIKREIETILCSGETPNEAICTRYYNGDLVIQFEPAIRNKTVEPESLIAALNTFASSSRRLETPSPEQEETTQNLRTSLATWASKWQDNLRNQTEFRNQEGVTLLTNLRVESEKQTSPQTADIVEKLLSEINPVLSEAKKPPDMEVVAEFIKDRLPVFIYFENYGILDSAIYLPRFLEDLNKAPNDPHTRTINAMFKHVSLTAQEITDLGRELTQQQRSQSVHPTPEAIAQDQQRKEARAIKLNSASLDISERFNNWYGQRRHTIDYQADGDYFRNWITDNRRPGVKIELEGRSKGFQWFFSFYLVFLVESLEGHKDAILLLDEPGLHLHPTAQQELLTFFEKLSEANQIIYSTHSPFLIV
ncbi:MAG: ATP-dependent nuclease [Bacillota bacterium]